MRTTIDLPPAEHALFRSIARARGLSLSAVIVELCTVGLQAGGSARQALTISPLTGLPTIASATPINSEAVRSFLDDDAA